MEQRIAMKDTTIYSLTKCVLAVIVTGITGGMLLWSIPVDDKWWWVVAAVYTSYFTSSHDLPTIVNKVKSIGGVGNGGTNDV